MAFHPKENRFLHTLPPAGAPGGVVPPGMRTPAVAAVPNVHPAPVTPHVMPIPGQKRLGPPPGRWDRLQAYLQKPAASIAPVKPDEGEPEKS